MLRKPFVVIVLTITVLVRNRLEYVTKKPIEKEREKLKIQETKKKSKEEMLNVRPKLFYIRNQINLGCSDFAHGLSPPA